ncbi:hypothetical protein ACKLNR_007299 [Fusarium oxysporum f. sp. zingiberi]
MAPIKTLLILFPGANTLDVNGPIETLFATERGSYFNITVASETDITVTAEGVQIKRDIPLDRALIDALDKYDVLVVPGGPFGPGSPVEAQANKKGQPFLDLIQAFSQLSPQAGGNERTLLSICTGAIYLGTLGILNGGYCTTHWASYDVLKGVNAAAAVAAANGKEAGKVLATRYVDSGHNEAGVRVISSGGISCGIDAGLHMISLYYDEDVAKRTAALLDYAWRKTEGAQFL